MRYLERFGLSRSRIIDGTVFQVPRLDFPRLLSEGVACGFLESSSAVENFSDGTFTIYPRVYLNQKNYPFVVLGRKSYILGAYIDGLGLISVENFSSISWKVTFEAGLNADHNYKNVGQYGLTHFNWATPREFFPRGGFCQIKIGSDVWIGRGSILKSTNPARPLIIGDGAVIASDSVVVRNVPPYAIVGGNPARFIKYRFSEDIIERLLRIKWWNWNLDKIYENFKYFNRVEEFVARHS